METPKKQPKQEKSNGKLAIILVRNTTIASNIIRDTLQMLRLQKKFTCLVLDNNRRNMGMCNKVKDFTTFGEVDEETIKLLNSQRGIKDAKGKTLNYYHLCPPRGGFERKGIKHNYEQGGALGYRREKMNDLLKKMV